MQALAGPFHVHPAWSWQQSDADPACVDAGNSDEDIWNLAYSTQGERAIDWKIDIAEIKEGEEDEHELACFKGGLKDGGNAASIFFAYPSHSQILSDGSTPSFRVFLSNDSRRYLMFRVFRI